ncbi:MAG TPA: hypothetical protein VG892_02365, partial [Terriglobales bacterium]|nr:hypothetical protein [Terriglobales bacterium]
MSFTSRNTLGLDIGSASIGWSLIDPENRRVAAGARIFDPGVDLQKFEKGEEGSSKNVDRRTARLHRRQLRRREGRQNELFCLLKKSGLMPSDSETTSKERGTVRHAILTRLDSELTAKWSQRIQESARAIAAPDQTLLYALRAFALDEPLQPEEIGRILYQLSQRRGFKSNRREGKGGSAERGKKNTAADERSKVKQGIKQLKEHISASGARTLGEYFSRLDPAEARIRTRWTSRQMFLDEFEQI